MAGQKFYHGWLGDSWHDTERQPEVCAGHQHRFEVDRQNPRVEVEIVDVEKNEGHFQDRVGVRR